MLEITAAERRLSEEEIGRELKKLDSWSISKGRLHKEFRFKNFAEALDFINMVGRIAESLCHHPTIFNDYSLVVIELETHSSKGLSMLDFSFANQLDSQF